MKKLTLSIGLLAGVLTGNAQDTITKGFKGNYVYTFETPTSSEFAMSKISEQTTRYEVKLNKNEVFLLDLYDDSTYYRKVYTVYSDGYVHSQKLQCDKSYIFESLYEVDFQIVSVLVSKAKYKRIDVETKTMKLYKTITNASR